RSYRHKPGTKALQELRKLQKSIDLLLPRAPFVRIVKEITDNFSKEVNRWQAEALTALQEVEYSIEAIKLGSTAIGLKTKGVVIVSRSVSLCCCWVIGFFYLKVLAY
ncbi:hypothetical protein MKW98_004938, partial [Papaver atlanticum]